MTGENHTSLFEHAGGAPALHRLEQIFSTSPRSSLPVCRTTRRSHRRGEHVEFGSRVAMQNSNAASDDELHPLREVPRWTWPDGP